LLILYFRKFACSQVRMLDQYRMLLILYFRKFACSQDRKFDQLGGDKTRFVASSSIEETF